jgi:hypothetical protein
MKKLLIILGLAAWVAVIVLMPPKAHPEESATPPVPSAPAAGLKASSRKGPETPVGAPETRDKARMADHRKREEARTLIDAAVVTYSPEGVKTIRPYLLDADPEIRGMARDAMVQLGEQDAIPLLRDAALHLKEQAEIASLHEAADLLALPAWSSSEEAATVIAEIMDESAR